MAKAKKPWTAERKQRALDLYKKGWSLDEIAKELGSNRRHVTNAIRSQGGTVRQRGAPMQRNGFWKGGRTIDKTGYVLVKIQNHPHANNAGYIREHRLVMEQILGRHLDPKEVVHHRNGDRSDNRPENLELFPSNGSHLAHELKGHCPNWSPEGRTKLREVARKRRKPAPNDRQTKIDGLE